METIIAKRVRNIGAYGIIKPLMRKKDNGDFIPVNSSQFPNSGDIFIPGGYGFLDDDLFEFESKFLQENDDYEQQLSDYQNKLNTKNPCKLVLLINPNRINKVLPTTLLPIYDNSFSLDEKKLFNSQNITAKYFFLASNDGSIYGPFEKDGNILKPSDFSQIEEDNNFYFYEGYNKKFIFKISTEKLANFITSDSEGRKYLVSFKDCITQKIGNILYYSTNDELNNWVIERLKSDVNFIINFKQNPTIQSVLNYITVHAEKLSLYPLDDVRWIKYKKIISDYQDNTSIKEEVIELVATLNPNEKENKSNLIEIEVLKDENKFLIEKNNKLIPENEALHLQVGEEKKAHQQLLMDYNSLERHNEQVEKITKLPTGRDFLNRISDDGKYFKEFTTLLENTTDREQKEKDLQKLKTEIAVKEKEIEKKNTENEILSDQKSKLQTTLGQIINDFNNQTTLNKNLIEAKIYNDILNGIDYTSETEKNTSSNIIPNIKDDLGLLSPKEYVNIIKGKLKIQGRDLDFNEVVNLVVTLQQSFITIFAGAPGVGKTSLAEKLAKSYGLTNDFGYLDIPCSRGWTSSKDLLGFYNPLNKKYQSSKTGLREALEKSSLYKNSPYFILLDEANLSPIEHYWSDFIKLADADYAPKIKFADKEIEFGKGLRFIATINYDHTTEMLSNRLIDRAAIIIIEPTKTSENKDIEIHEIHDWNKTVFPPAKDLDISLQSSLSKIEEILKKIAILISPRKKIAIENYCKVATGLLEGESKTSLDYAVCQHILPMINARGDEANKTLIDFKKFLDQYEMKKSSNLLQKIIEKGTEFKHFRYLYY